MPYIITYILSWLGLIERPRFHARFSKRHPSVMDLSESDFVIVRSGRFTKWACFRCPCGCGDKVALSLSATRRPAWRVSVDWLMRPTVKPSVWQQDRCFSHFWVTGGGVDWCQDSGRRPLSANKNGLVA